MNILFIFNELHFRNSFYLFKGTIYSKINIKNECLHDKHVFYKEIEQCMTQLLKLFINWYNERVNLIRSIQQLIALYHILFM
ncbi:hypothetical protein SASK001_23550 [Staphylococcus argenteus]|nr:hypothetical protein SA19082_23940 [Staphylococcus argenteus]GJF53068.1 hypothetical protein SA19086_23750 [Staphylococcus argenteus]GJF76332.1 hypothetical protein SA19220_24380 [Staphylococcus argenteus]GJF78911.1 hypothetical protein SA19223_24490 [Staphylococcus argenteus]GJF89205.1 hypothetical protein SA20092_24110 [Staphylococcus argenteus]